MTVIPWTLTIIYAHTHAHEVVSEWAKMYTASRPAVSYRPRARQSCLVMATHSSLVPRPSLTAFSTAAAVEKAVREGLAITSLWTFDALCTEYPKNLKDIAKKFIGSSEHRLEIFK